MTTRDAADEIDEALAAPWPWGDDAPPDDAEPVDIEEVEEANRWMRRRRRLERQRDEIKAVGKAEVALVKAFTDRRVASLQSSIDYVTRSLDTWHRRQWREGGPASRTLPAGRVGLTRVTVGSADVPDSIDEATAAKLEELGLEVKVTYSLTATEAKSKLKPGGVTGLANEKGLVPHEAIAIVTDEATGEVTETVVDDVTLWVPPADLYRFGVTPNKTDVLTLDAPPDDVMVAGYTVPSFVNIAVEPDGTVHELRPPTTDDGAPPTLDPGF